MCTSNASSGVYKKDATLQHYKHRSSTNRTPLIPEIEDDVFNNALELRTTKDQVREIEIGPAPSRDRNVITAHHRDASRAVRT
jgi:hypothetical protein